MLCKTSVRLVFTLPTPTDAKKEKSDAKKYKSETLCSLAPMDACNPAPVKKIGLLNTTLFITRTTQQPFDPLVIQTSIITLKFCYCCRCFFGFGIF